MPRRDAMLGDAELEVLKVLWDHGPLTVREVLGILQERGRDLAYTTVLTMMTRLEAKGAVASNRSGPAYVYRPRVSRDRIRRDRLKGLVEQLFDGAPGSLVLSLMKSESFTPEELAEFRGLIERLDPARQGRRVADGTDATGHGRGDV